MDKSTEIINRIKFGAAIALIFGGCYLGFDTISMIKSVLNKPTSLKKWLELGPSFMKEPKELDVIFTPYFLK